MTTTKTRVDSNQTVTTQQPEHKGILIQKEGMNGVNIRLPQSMNCDRQ